MIHMEAKTALEAEVAHVVARAVNLERPVEGIDPNAPLFREGWGLDSIDMLEIALAITKRYGFQLRSDDVENTKLFASLRALSLHIAKHRTR